MDTHCSTETPEVRRRFKGRDGSGSQRRRTGHCLWCVVVILCLLVFPVFADEYRTSMTSMYVPMLSQLTVSGDVSNLLTLIVDGAGESAYDAGHVESTTDAAILTINTNASWDLSAKLAGNWSCPGSYDKAENDLYIKITNSPTGTIQNGAASYINLGMADTQILNHTGAVSDNTVNIQSRVLLDWTGDIPGAYSITVTYTLVAHVE